MSQTLFDQTVAAWRQAAGDLGFQLEAPYVLKYQDRSFMCIAYLPHFGGVNGMVVGALVPLPSIGTQVDFRIAADKLNLYYSSINLESYSRYDKDKFIDTLSDWGYYGPAQQLPVWYQGGRA
jgi:hypothetical protein